jgi:hypothetical protein
MGCCVFINTNRQITNEELELFASNIESNKCITLNTISKYSNSKKEETPTSNNRIFPSSLIKSKDNPNGIVVIKRKN